MKTSVVPVRIASRHSTYEIAVGADVLRESGSWAANTLGSAKRKALIVSNARVYSLYGETVRRSFAKAGFLTRTHLIGDGERFKNIRTLERTLGVLTEYGFTRSDAVVALGGGVVGDLVSFAASVYLRGIGLLHIPTTLLAMIDSSVGGKTAINSPKGKNLIGSFYQPCGVLIDVNVLGTLPRRELTAGFCEAVKQGAVSGASLFGQTSDMLSDYPVHGFKRYFSDPRFISALIDLVIGQVAFKAGVVQNDEKESVTDASATSRKILNFGHTLAHALEKVTDYRYLKHGEAVGYGVKLAVELSKRLELISQNEVDSLNDVVHRAGILPEISHIDPSKVYQAFNYDKKKIGDSLQWILLRGIGKPVIVSGSDIPRSTLTASLKTIFQT